MLLPCCMTWHQFILEVDNTLFSLVLTEDQAAYLRLLSVPINRYFHPNHPRVKAMDLVLTFTVILLPLLLNYHVSGGGAVILGGSPMSEVFGIALLTFTILSFVFGLTEVCTDQAGRPLKRVMITIYTLVLFAAHFCVLNFVFVAAMI